MKHFKLLVTAVAVIMLASCQQQEDILPDNLPTGANGKITVCAEMPTDETTTRTTMESYKNAANYDAFRLFWQEGDVIEGVAWQGDDTAWWENARVLTIPSLTEGDLTDENKRATFTIEIPSGFDASQPLKIALFYVKDANNDGYSDNYMNYPISFSIPNRGLTWHNAQMVQAVMPSSPWEADFTYLTNRTPMMARTELPVGWTQAGQSISVPFHHLTTLFGFKIYNTSDADLELTGLELSVSDDTRKMFLADGAVIDPISGSVVPDAGKTSVTAISGITNNTIFPASADTYCLPCVVTGDMTGVEYSFKVNGQPAVTKTGKNYMPGVCYSIDIKWDGTNFSLLDHGQSSMFSYWISPDSTTLLRWFGDESVVDFSKIPDLTKISEIGVEAFRGLTKLKKVIISDNITSIGDGAFAATENMEELFIPSSVISIGEEVFEVSSVNVTVHADNPNYSSLDGVLFNKEKTILLHFPTSRTGTYTIPSTVKEIGVTAFENTNITSVIFPASLETVSYQAFKYSTQLVEVDFTSCPLLETIGEEAFGSGEALQSVHLPGSLVSINKSAFCWCKNLTTVTFAQPSSLTSIGYAAFNDTKVAYLVIPPSVNDFGYSATFSHCTELKEITLPDALTTIPNYAFFGCSQLKSITIPANVTNIEKSPFSGCSMVYAMPAVHPSLNGNPGLSGTLYNISQAAQSDYQNNGWTMFGTYKIMNPCDLSSNAVTMAVSGGNASIQITTNTSWAAVSTQSWLTVTPSGTGSATLTLNAAANATGKTRAAYVVITATDAPTRLVQVVQGK